MTSTLIHWQYEYDSLFDTGKKKSFKKSTQSLKNRSKDGVVGTKQGHYGGV